MTDAEQLALRIQAGDRDAEAQLVTEHRALAFSLGASWRPAFDEQDWRTYALMGLLRAARSWDPARCSLSHWAAVQILGELSHAARRERWFTGDRAHRLPRPSSIDAPITDDDGETRTVADLLPDEQAPDPDAEIEGDERRRDLAAALAMLTTRQRLVLLARAGCFSNKGEPVPLEAIGGALGVSRQRVQAIEARALQRARRAARGGAAGAKAGDRPRRGRAARGASDGCGERFQPARADARFCSGACRQWRPAAEALVTPRGQERTVKGADVDPDGPIGVCSAVSRAARVLEAPERP